MAFTSLSPSLEAKIVVLGYQGVGKTSLVHRFLRNDFIPPNQIQPTVGASFLTTRVQDSETGAMIRLQIWDTAGQERFRSISRLYYRGTNAAILAYDVTSNKSFEEMGAWLRELREQCGEDIVIHVVGTKTDIVAAEAQRREVSFERCISYVTEQLNPDVALPRPRISSISSASNVLPPVLSPVASRHSGFWAQELISDCCHEVSAKDGEGIDEVFRVITRKLVEKHTKESDQERSLQTLQLRNQTPRLDSAGNAQGYFDLPRARPSSFRVGYGDKRWSWLGGRRTSAPMVDSSDQAVDLEVLKDSGKGRCC